MPAIHALRARFTFGLKFAAAVALVALADIFFFKKTPGSTLGLFAFAWIVALIIVMPCVWRRWPPLIALGCATIFGIALIYDPSVLSWILFWAALSSATLLPRRRFEDALHFLLRLVIQGIVGLPTPVRDALHLARLPRPNLRSSILSVAAALGLPIFGGAIFIALFAHANPLIDDMLPDFTLPFWNENAVPRLLFWLLAFVLVWPSLRPDRLAVGMRPFSERKIINLPGINAISVTVSFVLFNLLFAIENLLDIAFLWSGAPLPKGVTMADYAHRGAYPLIVTALLAGAFVLVTARPDSEIGQRPLIRRLVALWIAQNLFLVMSSALRTVDYIDAYMLTRLRLAALVWMGLVAIGLALICWRMLKRRSVAWLINANALAAAVVLGLASFADLGSITAAWNVAHARETGGAGQELDLGYLHELGPSALVSLATLERRPLPPLFRDRVASVREQIVAETIRKQNDPYGWTWRDAERLAMVRSMTGATPYVPAHTPYPRTWDGSIEAPTYYQPSAPAVPLTPNTDQ